MNPATVAGLGASRSAGKGRMSKWIAFGLLRFATLALTYMNRRAQMPRRGISSAVVPAGFLHRTLVGDSKGTKAVPLAPSLHPFFSQKKGERPFKKHLELDYPNSCETIKL